jgi:hypothetical protein
MLLGHVMSANTAGVEQPFRFIVPALSVYAFLAVAFVTLGVGSIRARRWARALSLVLAWSWLIVGVLSTAVAAFVMPKVLARSGAGGDAIPESARLVATVVALVVLGVIFVLLPTAFVVFYQGKSVRLTCESRDPATRWTDDCPLAVLALSLWLWYAGVSMLVMQFAYQAVFPFFGFFVSGVAGVLIYLVLAAFWLYLGWVVYRLKPSAWWFLLAAGVVFSASAVVTFARADMIEMYRLMGYPEAQIAQLQKFNFLQGNWMVGLVAFCFLAFLGYLIYVKEFFKLRGA